jgi:predicted dehydrogenase
VRDEFGHKFVWGVDGEEQKGQAWERWEDWVELERGNRERGESSVDVAFVCVLDEMHVAACKALGELGGIHVLCEKPLATSLQDCLDIWAAMEKSWDRTGVKTVFGVGHVLRYSPHNVLLRKLLREDRVIGDVMSIEHTEPVGWWHFTHSYVRSVQSCLGDGGSRDTDEVSGGIGARNQPQRPLFSQSLVMTLISFSGC